MRFILKTIPKDEAKLLRALLPSYVDVCRERERNEKLFFFKKIYLLKNINKPFTFDGRIFKNNLFNIIYSLW